MQDLTAPDDVRQTLTTEDLKIIDPTWEMEGDFRRPERGPEEP